jgi:acyl-CoA thioesterase-2
VSEPLPPRESLAEILQIEACGDGSYAAGLESFWGGTVAGDLLARATLVATTDRPEAPCATQATFVSQPSPEARIALTCEDFAPGCRRVRVHQGSGMVCAVTLRFGPAGDGLSYQSLSPRPGLPAPEDLPSEVELARTEGWEPYAVGPIESRRIGTHEPVKDDEPAVWLGWLRPREALANDPRVQAAALAFLGEYRSHWAVERRLGAEFPRSSVTLLDHALFLHRPERWDDWWLVETRTDVGVGGRCFSRREIYTRRGALVASAAWQAAVRPKRTTSPS